MLELYCKFFFHGKDGAAYAGSFSSPERLKIVIEFYGADDKQIGRPMFWTGQKYGLSGNIAFNTLIIKIPNDVVSILTWADIPGIGRAKARIELK